MGRQIRILQLDSDIKDMLAFLKQHNLRVFKNGVELTRIDELYQKQLVAINDEYIPNIGFVNSPIEYSVPYPLDTTLITTARFYACNSPRYEVEKTEGKKIISEGRFYLANEYYNNDAIVAVYNLLKKYVKKNYVYSKDQEAYFSKLFIEGHKKGNVYYAQGNNVFPVTDV